METASRYLATITEARTSDGLLVIQVKMGRYYLNRAWHVIWLDLKEVVQRAFYNYEGSFGELNKSDWDIVKADKIIIRGRMFRMDNICFRVTDHLRLDQQDFFECGPWGMPSYLSLIGIYLWLIMKRILR